MPSPLSEVTPPAPLSVAIYARVSTTDQNIKQQVDAVKDYCKHKGYNILEVYKDVYTGIDSLQNRKEFQRLLKHIQEGRYQKVVVYSTDRLTRDYYDGIEIEKFFRSVWDTCQLESPTSLIDFTTADGRLQFRIQLVIACHSVEKTKERMVLGIERAKKEGKYKGRKKGAKNKVME